MNCDCSICFQDINRTPDNMYFVQRDNDVELLQFCSKHCLLEWVIKEHDAPKQRQE